MFYAPPQKSSKKSYVHELTRFPHGVCPTASASPVTWPKARFRPMDLKIRRSRSLSIEPAQSHREGSRFLASQVARITSAGRASFLVDRRLGERGPGVGNGLASTGAPRTA